MLKLDVATLARQAIAQHLCANDDEAVDTASFVDDLGADSLDCIEMIMAAEDQFGVQISDDEGAACKTVGEAIKLIEAKVRASAGV